MLKYLRIAVTTLSLTACVLLVALWVRSYQGEDVVYGWFPSDGYLEISSNQGGIRVIATGASSKDGTSNPRELTRYLVIRIGILC